MRPDARDRELRAERARCAPPRRDDRRDRDLLARRAPLLCLRQHVVHLAMMLAMDDPLDDVLAQVDAGRARRPAAGARLPRGAGRGARRGGAERRRGGARCCSSRPGGDPHRELDVDDRAVKSLAADLYTRRAAASSSRAAIDALVAARARPAGRARGGALPRRRHRPRVAAVRARAARRGARRVTPAVEAAKRAGHRVRAARVRRRRRRRRRLRGRRRARPRADRRRSSSRRSSRRSTATLARVRRAGRPAARPARRRASARSSPTGRRPSARPGTSSAGSARSASASGCRRRSTSRALELGDDPRQRRAGAACRSSCAPQDLVALTGAPWRDRGESSGPRDSPSRRYVPHQKLAAITT